MLDMGLTFPLIRHTKMYFAVICVIIVINQRNYSVITFSTRWPVVIALMPLLNVNNYIHFNGTLRITQ